MSSNTVEQPQASTDAPLVKALTKAEKRKANELGYSPRFQESLGAVAIRQKIRAKEYRPGSSAYNRAHGSPIPDSMTDEGIEAAQEGKPEHSGVDVSLSEYTQRFIRGDSPIEAMLNDYAARFPGKRFRLINPELPPTAGPPPQMVHENGKSVQCGDLFLAWWPDEIYDEYYVKQNKRRSELMTGKAVEVDEDIGVSGVEAQLQIHGGKQDGRLVRPEQGLHTETHVIPPGERPVRPESMRAANAR